MVERIAGTLGALADDRVDVAQVAEPSAFRL
jgi:hypothetical protein